MRHEVKLPFLGENNGYCRVLRWLVQPGARVEIDQDLAELETDGERFIFPSPLDGVLTAILAPAGSTVVTDEALAVIDEDPIYEDGIRAE